MGDPGPLKCMAPSCRSPGKTYSPRAEMLLAPPRASIDWELFIRIGYRRFEHHWSVPQLRAEPLDSHRVVLSEDTIEAYVHRYEVVVAARQGDVECLKTLYAKAPGLMLSIDGLQPEKGHETLEQCAHLQAIEFGSRTISFGYEQSLGEPRTDDDSVNTCPLAWP